MSHNSTSNEAEASSASKTFPSRTKGEENLDAFLNRGWLRAHQRNLNSYKIIENPDTVISLSDNTHLEERNPCSPGRIDDQQSIFNIGNINEGEEDLHDFFSPLDIEPSTSSILGKGRGKDLNQCAKIFQEDQNDEDEEIESHYSYGDGDEVQRGEDRYPDDDDHQAEADVSEDEDEALSISPIRFAFDFPSPSPYNPDTYEHEIDYDFPESYTEADKIKYRKEEGVVSCAGLASEISSEEIMYLMEYFNLQGKWLKPRLHMRMHWFDVPLLQIPRMVLTNKLVEVGFGYPMHRFLHEIIEFYKIAPLQLSPNSYRIAIGLYMLYRNNGYEAPSLEEINYFLSLRKSGSDLGFYYLAFFAKHNKKGFYSGNPSNMKIWKADYFYLYDVPRVRTQFNLNAFQPKQSVLSGDALDRAEHILNLSPQEKNFDVLVTSESLQAHGFYNSGFGQISPVKFKRNSSKRVLRKITKHLTGRGKKMQLPFGGNPFAKPATANPTSAAGQSRPQNIVPTILTAPPPPMKEKDKGKRGINDIPKGTSKRSKFGTTEGDPPLQLISATFGSLAANHYSDDDAKLFMKRNSNDAEFAFKMGLGEAFYHGLNVLTEKNNIIQDQEKGLKKLKGEASSLKDQLSNVQKQLDKESKARKDEVGKLQDECTRLAADAKQAGEASKKEKEEMQFKLDELNKKMEKELSDAYSLGFLGYLKNFLAADPDYDWSVHFAPSTSHYISTFKAENAKSIEEARKELLQKIESELKTKAEEEARKQTTGGDAEADNISGASPSNTTAS